MKDILTVQVFTVKGQLQPLECDDVLLPISDSVNGSFSGSYGIRPGHAPAVFSLKAGVLQLSLQGKRLFNANVSEGFATVENNEVRITVESVSVVE